MAQINNPFPNVPADSSTLKIILQIVFGVIGAVALISIVLAGMKFVTSMGRPEEVAKARQAVIYAGVGLAVAASAEIIVTFVLGSL